MKKGGSCFGDSGREMLESQTRCLSLEPTELLTCMPGGEMKEGRAHARPEVSSPILGCCQGDLPATPIPSPFHTLREILANHTNVTWKKLIFNIIEIWNPRKGSVILDLSAFQ